MNAPETQQVPEESSGRGRGRGKRLPMKRGATVELGGASNLSKQNMLGMLSGLKKNEIHFTLAQKPTKAFMLKLENTIRDLKRKGFGLYYRCKREMRDLMEEVKKLMYKIKEE